MRFRPGCSARLITFNYISLQFKNPLDGKTALAAGQCLPTHRGNRALLGLNYMTLPWAAALGAGPALGFPPRSPGTAPCRPVTCDPRGRKGCALRRTCPWQWGQSRGGDEERSREPTGPAGTEHSVWGRKGGELGWGGGVGVTDRQTEGPRATHSGRRGAVCWANRPCWQPPLGPPGLLPVGGILASAAEPKACEGPSEHSSRERVPPPHFCSWERRLRAVARVSGVRRLPRSHGFHPCGAGPLSRGRQDLGLQLAPSPPPALLCSSRLALGTLHCGPLWPSSQPSSSAEQVSLS